MAFVAGNFDASALQNIKTRANSMWGSDAWNKQWKRPTGIFNDLSNRQSISLTPDRDNPERPALTNGRSCQTVECYFLQDTLGTAVNYAGDNTDCDFDGQELGSDKVDYSTADLAIFRRKVISKKCKELIEFQELSAQAIENIKSDLDLDAEKKFISHIISSVKTVTGFTPTTGTIVGGNDWQIAAANVNAELIAELRMSAELLRMTDPVIVSGSTFYLDKIVASAQSGGGCCNVNSLLTQEGFANTHNIVDLDSLAGGQKFYLVDMATMAFVNTWEHDNMAPMSNVADLFFFSMESRRLTWNSNLGTAMPLKYDFRMKRKCTGASGHDFSDVYEGKLAGAFLESPQPEGTTYPNVVQISVV